ncbi:MAG TPA: hypothetical protein PLH94_13130 [Fimbriimonadaceae bacterium]|nr:hypothetical protein [Fimbriimonadaceae bacterium]
MQYSQEFREHIEHRSAAPAAPVLMPYLCVRRVERKKQRALYSEKTTNCIGHVCMIGFAILAILGGVIAWGP